MKKCRFPRWSLLILVVITMLVYTACGSASSSSSYPQTGIADNEYYEDEYTQDSEFGETADRIDKIEDKSRKLIKNVDMDIETKEFDKLTDALEKKLAEVKGYVENSESYGTNYNSVARRSSRIVVRVPSDKLDEFVSTISGMGNVTRKTENVEDVTMSYIDIESRKKALIIEQDRILALLEKADNLEDVITLEQRLSDIRYQLESYEAQLRTYDNKVDYSTVTVNIQEVEIISPKQPKNAWERMSTGFSQNLTKVGNGFVDLAVMFVAYLPFIFLIGLLVGGITFAIIKILKVTSRPSNSKVNKGGALAPLQQKPQPPLQQQQPMQPPIYAPMSKQKNQQSNNVNPQDNKPEN